MTALETCEQEARELADELHDFITADTALVIMSEHLTKAKTDGAKAAAGPLAQSVWDALRILGFDTDGDQTPAAFTTEGYAQLGRVLIKTATDVRACYDEALDAMPDEPRRVESDTAFVDVEHPDDCDCDSGPCEGKGHAETMRREADHLHRMCDDDRDDGLIHLPRTSPTAGI